MKDTPGRPRDAAIDPVVLDTTIRLLEERGYAGLRINDIAEASGAAKTTIYRRWPTLAHLVVAAMERALGERGTPSTPDPVGDLERLVEAGSGIFAPALLGIALDIHRQPDPELRAAYRRRIIDPIRDRAQALIAAGIEQGAIAATASPEQLTDAIIGGLVYRAAILNEPVSVAEAKEFGWSILGGAGSS